MTNNEGPPKHLDATLDPLRAKLRELPRETQLAVLDYWIGQLHDMRAKIAFGQKL